MRLQHGAATPADLTPVFLQTGKDASIVLKHIAAKPRGVAPAGRLLLRTALAHLGEPKGLLRPGGAACPDQ